MLASPSSSQTCLPFIPLNGMPLLPAHARHSAPPISLRSFRWRQQASVTCMAAQPQKSNFETRWAARQRDWRTQLAQLQRRIRCVHSMHRCQLHTLSQSTQGVASSAAARGAAAALDPCTPSTARPLAARRRAVRHVELVAVCSFERCSKPSDACLLYKAACHPAMTACFA